MIKAPSVTTAQAPTKRIHGQRRRAFDFSFRNPQTGKFNSGQPIPSPRAMQSAYPPGASRTIATAGIPDDLRTIAAAAGTAPVKSHPAPLLGEAAKAETTDIAETIKRFLISRAMKGPLS
jgi:hypothetical protein